MKFNEVGHYFDLIEQKSSRTAVTELLAELFEQANAREAQIICNLSLGQLHPPYIGTQFNMAEKNLFKVVAQLLGESVEEIKKAKKKTGDIGTPVMDGKWKPIGDPTVVQVYDELCKIEETSGTGSQEKKASELLKLLKSLDPTSAKFVVRIVLGKLRIGFSEMTLVDALSWMCIGDKSLRKKIEHAYNICVDIGLIAARLKKDGIKGIEHMKIEVGIPIRPAAAERLPSAKAIVDKLGDCVAQPKLDGFRLQVHVKKKKSGKREIHFFSRNLQDMSSMFPDLEKVFEKLPIDSLICEGEAIVFDPSTGSFLPFQETVKRKRKHGIEAAMEQLPLQFFIFDLLYLNGESLLSDTHEQRRKMLQDLFKNFKNNVIKVVEEKKIETAKELEDYFNANIAAGLEGLVVKRLDSMYTPGKRNFNWIKLKRQEEGRLDDTLDCVILGYYDGSGRRAKFGIGAFLVGVLHKTKDCFETVAKVGTGLSDDAWVDLKKRCDEIAVKIKPKNVECAKELYPDVWVSPEIICLICADEITLSPTHVAGKTEKNLGYALRFPRFMGYRPDKSVDEATTVKEIRQLYKNQFKR